MELGQYVKRILRWWWLIVLSTTIAAVASYIASSQQPKIYQTTTTLLVGQVIAQSDVKISEFSTIEQLAESYAQIAVRQPVLQATVDSLSLQTGWQSLKRRVFASPIPGTQLLAISVQDQSPKLAVAIADEVAHQLILQTPTSLQNEERAKRSEFVQSQLDTLEGRIQRAQTRITELETELNNAFSASQIQDLQTEINNLNNLIKSWQTNYTELLTFFEGGDSPNSLTVIEPAQLPTVPISPIIEINVLLAAAVGFMLALGAALLLEYFDNTLKSADDIGESLGLTVLGSIERIAGRDYHDKLLTSHSPFSSVSEAYRLVRSNIQFMKVDQPAKSIVITSSNFSEGKSITAANLAVIMAQAELRTIIVDADLRQPTLHKIFGLPNLGGLTELLLSPELEINSHMRKSEIANLHVITSGPLPPNPAELLSTKRMSNLVQCLEEIADVVIFDSPPVLAVTDSTILSNWVGGVVLVTQAGRTRRDLIKQAIKRLDQVGANILGIVLNQVSRKSGGSHHYSQYYAHSGARLIGQRGHLTQRRWWQRLPVLK